MEAEKFQDKIRGSLMGGAIGDAFGYPLEFIPSKTDIKAKYGDSGLTEYDLSYPWLDESQRFQKALFSDDTQMTLYTAEGLLEAERGGTLIEFCVGAGWVAEETLAIAIFSVLRYIDDFDACLVCAVNHGGDSDSTGAVAGNIIGAIVGYEAIPEKFTDSIQLHDLILDMADTLGSLKVH